MVVSPGNSRAMEDRILDTDPLFFRMANVRVGVGRQFEPGERYIIVIYSVKELGDHFGQHPLTYKGFRTKEPGFYIELSQLFHRGRGGPLSMFFEPNVSSPFNQRGFVGRPLLRLQLTGLKPSVVAGWNRGEPAFVEFYSP